MFLKPQAPCNAATVTRTPQALLKSANRSTTANSADAAATHSSTLLLLLPPSGTCFSSTLQWASVVNDPARRKTFRQFVNTDATEKGIGFMPDRDQYRPVDWPKDSAPLTLPTAAAASSSAVSWVKMGGVEDFPKDGGATVKYGASQLAVYRFDSRDVSV